MKYSDTELENILKFTNALADRLQDENKIDFAAMQTTDESLDEVELSTKAYAAKRKRQAGFSDVEEIYADNPTDEDGAIRDRLRSWIKRTNRDKFYVK